MRKIIGFLIFICNFNMLYAGILKVAVIDTGLNLKYTKNVPLCKSENKDFTGEGFNDIVGHGTNVTGIIVKGTDFTQYCIVLIKAYAYTQNKKAYLTEALQYAYDIKANIINLSGGGLNPIESERRAVKKILDANITLVVAAGNEGLDLDKNCNYYPACYDKRIYSIGNYSDSSNYGKIIKTSYNANDITGFDITLSGTSQAAALFTNDLLKKIAKLKEVR